MSDSLLAGLTASVKSFNTKRVTHEKNTKSKSKKGSVQVQYAALEKVYKKETSHESA